MIKLMMSSVAAEDGTDMKEEDDSDGDEDYVRVHHMFSRNPETTNPEFVIFRENMYWLFDRNNSFILAFYNLSILILQ